MIGLDSSANSGVADRPNIVLILADDMGFSDLGCYGSEIETPTLDSLARDGLRFTQAYNCARCCPTRASLLTGLYPHQAGVGHMTRGVASELPSYQGYLRESCVTIAEALKAAGYRTGISGKWHVGGEYPPRDAGGWHPGDEHHPLPTQRGFDRFYGTLHGGRNYFNPQTLMEGDRFVDAAAELDEDYYYTDAINDRAVEMIEGFHGEGSPFFLYVAHYAPHWPLHALPEDIARYEGRYRQGWTAVREARYRRLLEEGLIDGRWSNSPRNRQVRPWDEVEDQEWEAMRMAVYAAQLDRMDQGLGRVVGKLKELKILENTLVLFLSDNGGCAEQLRRGGWVEGMAPPRTRMGEPIKPGNDPRRMPGGEDTFMSYGLPWANVSNTPFRLFKHWVHEGGIATPLIVHWPAVVQKGGRVVDGPPLHVIDVMPTLLDIAGVPYPDHRSGVRTTPLAGESFLPLLEGGRFERRRPIFWEHEGNCAVRRGEWKLVSQYPSKWELYNMSDDRTELRDVADSNRTIVRELEEEYREWACRCGVLLWEEVQEYL